MPLPADKSGLQQNKLHLGDFAKRFLPEALPLGNVFSFFAAAVPFSGDEIREYVEEPATALPPDVLKMLNKAVLIFVPYLEKPEPVRTRGRRHGTAAPPAAFDPATSLVAMDKEAGAQQLPVAYLSPSGKKQPHVLAFGIRSMDASDYHFNFFYTIASIVYMQDPARVLNGYSSLLREELKGRAHGEVDEASWKAKQELQKKQSGVRGDSKLFREYARQSFIDTMTLYLHGICCDIDVEPGPRQIASRHLRKRIVYLQSHYPQPQGYAVFPEELKN